MGKESRVAHPTQVLEWSQTIHSTTRFCFVGRPSLIHSEHKPSIPGWTLCNKKCFCGLFREHAGQVRFRTLKLSKGIATGLNSQNVLSPPFQGLSNKRGDD